MRIVAGRDRGRGLTVPAGRQVRPTSDRARGAVFNILEHGIGGFAIKGARVLDAFAGTGALGLEALSRGAAHATFIERDRAALEALGRNLATIARAGESTVLRTDATRPPPAIAPCDLVFLDPPYRQGLTERALSALWRAGWLGQGAVVVVETAADEDFTLPEGFDLLDRREYGEAGVRFLTVSGTGAAGV